MDKKELLKLLQKDPSKYWKVPLFDKDWSREKCPSCSKYFWTFDSSRKLCGDSSCEEYSFIGKSRKDWDYIETWRQVEKFFVKNGHSSLDRYPVLCRWRPDLYFTVASIIDFQRLGKEGVEFHLPKNPLIIPQVCLRFNDIPNIGVTGRHHSSFIMVGQHSMPPEGYWKDKTIDLDYRMLTEIFGIKPEEITFVEDAWAGGGAGGYSLEYFAGGLELGNAVFTEFKDSKSGLENLKKPVVDMGGGLERYAWYLSGALTSYDSAFGSVMKSMKVDYDKDLFARYTKLSGKLDFEDNLNLKKSKEDISKKLGLDMATLKNHIEKQQAVYSIADHAKTLLFALNDGAMPSNTAYGYNLRLILRRALSLIEEHQLPYDIIDVMEWHQNYLKKLHKELKVDDRIREIVDYDKKKYEETRKNISKRISSLFEKKIKIDESLLMQLYDSEGIQPTMIEEEARRQGIKIDVPSDFYSRISEKHMSQKIEEEEREDLPPTENLWHSDAFEFDSRVLKTKDNWTVLERTAFYPEGGGQKHDTGTINGIKVIDVQRHGDVVYHMLERPLPKGTKEVHGSVDEERRIQLMAHHDATHIIHGICHRMLGSHIWQNSALKDVDKARLDITHYKNLTPDDLKKMEREANEIVKENRKIAKTVLPRHEAESKYGFTLYQGGVPLTNMLRVVDIDGIDIEACGGSHGDSTGYIKKIKIIDSEKIQDGVVRINFVAWKAAENYERSLKRDKETVLKKLGKLYSSLSMKAPEKTLDSLIKGFDESVEAVGGHIEKIVDKIEGLSKKGISEAGKAVRMVDRITEDLQAGKTIDNILHRLDGELGKIVDRFEEKEADRHVEKIQFRELKTGVRALVKMVDVDAPALQKISEKMSSDDTVIFLINPEGNVFASAGETSSQYYGVGVILKEMFIKFGGKGGGSPHLGQGVVPKEKAGLCLKWLESRLL